MPGWWVRRGWDRAFRCVGKMDKQGTGLGTRWLWEVLGSYRATRAIPVGWGLLGSRATLDTHQLLGQEEETQQMTSTC